MGLGSDPQVRRALHCWVSAFRWMEPGTWVIVREYSRSIRAYEKCLRDVPWLEETTRACIRQLEDAGFNLGLTHADPKLFLEPDLVIPTIEKLRGCGVELGKKLVQWDQLHSRHVITSGKFHDAVTDAVAGLPSRFHVRLIAETAVNVAGDGSFRILPITFENSSE